jgi:hypothetical protein
MKLTDQKLQRLLIFLIVLASLLRIFICFQHNPLDYLFSDPKRHWLNGQRLFNPDLIGAGDALLYQVYIYVLHHVVGDNRYLVALACSLLSIVMPWTYYRAARELGMSKNSSLVVWTLIGWMPSLFTIYHFFMSETLLLPLIGLSLWMTARFLRKGTREAWLLAVLCWTLTVLTKAIVVPLVVICLGYAWWTKSRQWSLAVLGLALGLILLIPNTIRTWRYSGFPAPLGNSWVVKIQHRSGAREIKVHSEGKRWVFVSPSVAVQPLEPLSPWAIRRAWHASTVYVDVDIRNGESDWKRKFDSLDVGWKEWRLLWIENILLFLFSPSWPDSQLNEWDGSLVHHARWLWAPLIFFLIDCNLRELLKKRWNLIPIATMSFTLFLMLQNLATTEGRYRKPVEPLLLLNLMWVTAPRDQKEF